MRAYSAADEEALLARNLLKDWAGEGFLTEAQYRRLEPDTACELRRTNIFLRVVLFLFTLLIVAAAVGLFFAVSSTPVPQTVGILLVIFAAISYAAAEFAVSEAQLYRYGIEEALASCSVGLLCAGMQIGWFNGPNSLNPDRMKFLVPAAGALVSLWIWHRFGFPYAFLASMIFAVFLPGHWTSSRAPQHLIIVVFYAAGLVALMAIRPSYRFTYLDERYAMAEAMLWLGVYLAINLQLSAFNPVGLHWWPWHQAAAEFSRPFYWTTWVLTWCLPPAVLWRGVRLKDRLVIAAGGLTGILSLVTNKPYLNWPRHSWDPMLLGVLLFGLALFVRRWLAQGVNETRHGFTARRLSGKDKRWLEAGSAAWGFVSPPSTTASPQAEAPPSRFGGGESGGGGATSDF